MNTGVWITGIIVAGLVLIVWLASRMTPGEKRTQHPCYFAGVHVVLGDAVTELHVGATEPSGRRIGQQDCSGPPEFVYAHKRGFPAHALSELKVCPAHVGSMHELSAALNGGLVGYWIVPS